MLFVRAENKRGGVTLPFLWFGFADYVSHEGERPMAIRWPWRCERQIQPAQSTSCSPSTRLNSLTLWLTTVAPMARA